MMKTYITAGLAALIVNLPTLVHAEDCCIPAYTPGEMLCDDEVCGIYSQYAGTQLDCGWNVFAWGEFLYWRPTPATAIQSITFEGDPPGTLQVQLSDKYGYRPAFRVGIGMIAPCFDNWAFNVDYTWYHHGFKVTNSRELPVTLASTIGFFPIPLYSSIETRTDFNYDIVGLSVQRPNYLGQRVIISPFLGLKWLKRNNKLAQNLQIAGTDLIDNQHAQLGYSSIGLAAGFDGSLLLCWNLKLIGKADVAILYAYHRKFNQLSTASIETPPVVPYPLRVKQNERHLDLLGKGGLGLGWGSYFCCQRYHVDFSATFDYLADIVKLAYSSGMFGNGSMQFIGLTVHGQLDF